MDKIILASASKRRIDLLERLKVPFDVIVSDLEEIMDESCEPSMLVTRLAQQKAKHVARITKQFDNAIYIAADTLVVLDGQTIGKPKDSDDARRTLRLLGGKTHQVYTGCCCLKKKNAQVVQEEIFFEKTAVTMRDYTENEIEAYVATGDPLDKAGSYGIQSLGMVLVERLDGDYYNVEGLPVAKLFCCLKKFEVDLSRFWTEHDKNWQ